MGKFYEGLAEQLTFFVRYTAWLNTPPVVDKKAARLGNKEVRAPTRLEELRRSRKDDTYMPQLPDVAGGEYVLQCFWEVGPSLSTPMGASPLTHAEMRAWQENTGAELEPWQARLLRRLSAEYLAECSRAEKPDAPSPLAVVLTDEERKTVADKVKNAMQMFMQKKRRK